MARSISASPMPSILSAIISRKRARARVPFRGSVESRPGEFSGTRNFRLATGVKGGLERLTGGRVDGMEGLARGQNGFTSDELRAF